MKISGVSYKPVARSHVMPSCNRFSQSVMEGGVRIKDPGTVKSDRSHVTKRFESRVNCSVVAMELSNRYQIDNPAPSRFR